MVKRYPEFQPHKFRYLGAAELDNFLSLPLTAKNKELNEFDLQKVVSGLEVYQQERKASGLFRIYGTIEHMSFLNNRPSTWNNLKNLIQDDDLLSGSNRELNQIYDIRLGYVKEYIPLGDSTEYFQQKIGILTPENYFDVLPCGYATNIFREPLSNIVPSQPIDISNLTTEGLPTSQPVTELCLLFLPKENYKSRTYLDTAPYETLVVADSSTGGFTPVALDRPFQQAIINNIMPPNLSTMNTAGFVSLIWPMIINVFELLDLKVTVDAIIANRYLLQQHLNLMAPGVFFNLTDHLPSTPIAVGDTIVGGVVRIDQVNLTIEEVMKQEYSFKRSVVETSTVANRKRVSDLGYRYSDTGILLTTTIGFTYNPINWVTIRTFSSYVESGTQATVEGIPSYALPAPNNDDTGLFLWRDLLDIGFKEPDTGIGVDYPFINGSHYRYSNILLQVQPDFTNYNAFRAFHNAYPRTQLLYQNIIR